MLKFIFLQTASNISNLGHFSFSFVGIMARFNCGTFYKFGNALS